jgi:hypothetical protein
MIKNKEKRIDKEDKKKEKNNNWKKNKKKVHWEFSKHIRKKNKRMRIIKNKM